MDTSTIVSVRGPATERERVLATPSPVLELVYAHFYLTARLDRVPAQDRVPWATSLLEEDPELVGDLQALWPEEAPHALLMVAAAEFEYLTDATPERFLADAPGLPRRFRDTLEKHIEEAESDDVSEDVADDMREWWQKVLASGAALDGATWTEAARRLGDLWSWLEPTWQREGHLRVDEACQDFRHKFAEANDVVGALPSHHFVQFEHAAAHIREAARSKRVLVIPLFHATDGGVNLDLVSVQVIAYGLQSERMFEAVHARVSEAARAAKALGDPTRLMMLTLIARYGRFALTVGDLARQLDVSQPTVSGHLRNLRELGFVTLSKKGTRSYYHLDADAVRGALEAIEGLVLE